MWLSLEILKEFFSTTTGAQIVELISTSMQKYLNLNTLKINRLHDLFTQTKMLSQQIIIIFRVLQRYQTENEIFPLKGFTSAETKIFL